MHALLLATLFKAATVIVSGNVAAPNAQDLVLVGVGTGVVVERVDANHYAVVTAAHVARYSDPHVAFYGHPRAHPHVEMTLLDPRGEDVAVLIVRSALRLPVIALASQDPPVGSNLEVVGHPYAHTWHVNHATYVQGAIRPSRQLRPLLTADSNLWICPGCDRGNSGSGIYDTQGRLAALIYAAAPLSGYRKADAHELRTDTYNPRIVREVLAINASEVRRVLRSAEKTWHDKGYASASR